MCNAEWSLNGAWQGLEKENVKNRELQTRKRGCPTVKDEILECRLVSKKNVFLARKHFLGKEKFSLCSRKRGQENVFLPRRRVGSTLYFSPS